jgi:hypothetical protein
MKTTNGVAYQALLLLVLHRLKGHTE